MSLVKNSGKKCTIRTAKVHLESNGILSLTRSIPDATFVEYSRNWRRRSQTERTSLLSPQININTSTRKYDVKDGIMGNVEARLDSESGWGNHGRCWMELECSRMPRRGCQESISRETSADELSSFHHFLSLSLSFLLSFFHSFFLSISYYYDYRCDCCCFLPSWSLLRAGVVYLFSCFGFSSSAARKSKFSISAQNSQKRKKKPIGIIRTERLKFADWIEWWIVANRFVSRPVGVQSGNAVRPVSSHQLATHWQRWLITAHCFQLTSVLFVCLLVFEFKCYWYYYW